MTGWLDGLGAGPVAMLVLMLIGVAVAWAVSRDGKAVEAEVQAEVAALLSPHAATFGAPATETDGPALEEAPPAHAPVAADVFPTAGAPDVPMVALHGTVPGAGATSLLVAPGGPVDTALVPYALARMPADPLR